MNAMTDLRTEDRLTADLMYPLKLFYERIDRPAPPFERIFGQQMPQPHKQLLMHDGDMTPTLEAYHGDRLHLRKLDEYHDDTGYFRQVVLVRDRDGAAVEFGAIRIVLPMFPVPVQRLIREGRVPLGAILGEHAVAHRSRPRGFFRVRSDEWIDAALGLGPGSEHTLYGRRNVLVNHADQTVADVVEILPPGGGGRLE